MHITFSQTDIENILKNHVRRMGYVVNNIEQTESGSYIVEISTVEGKIKDIIDKNVAAKKKKVELW